MEPFALVIDLLRIFSVADGGPVGIHLFVGLDYGECLRIRAFHNGGSMKYLITFDFIFWTRVASAPKPIWAGGEKPFWDIFDNLGTDEEDEDTGKDQHDSEDGTAHEQIFDYHFHRWLIAFSRRFREASVGL